MVAVPPPRTAPRAATVPPEAPEERPRPRPAGPAVDPRGPEATRALIRAGQADPADGPPTAPVPAVRATRASEGPDRRPPASTNGDTASTSDAAPVVRQRPPGQRRTRPLRAT